MNSQFFPGLSETFIQQEHARLLEEATRRRMLRQGKSVEPPLPDTFSLELKIARKLPQFSAPTHKMMHDRRKYEHAK